MSASFTHLQMRLEGYRRAYVKRVGHNIFIRPVDGRDTVQLRIMRVNKNRFNEDRAGQIRI